MSGMFGGKMPEVKAGTMPDLMDRTVLEARRNRESSVRNRQGRMSTFLSDALKKLASVPQRTN